jgi:hypothetical protein
VLGLGLWIGSDDPQDLLLDSCGRGPLARHAPALRTDLVAGPLGTLLALATTTGPRFHLAAFPRRSAPVRDLGKATGTSFVVAVAPPYGRWTTVGTLRCDEPAADQNVRLSPANTGLGLRLSPWWQGFRVASYRTSRRAAQDAGATR